MFPVGYCLIFKCSPITYLHITYFFHHLEEKWISSQAWKVSFTHLGWVERREVLWRAKKAGLVSVKGQEAQQPRPRSTVGGWCWALNCQNFQRQAGKVPHSRPPLGLGLLVLGEHVQDINHNRSVFQSKVVSPAWLWVTRKPSVSVCGPFKQQLCNCSSNWTPVHSQMSQAHPGSLSFPFIPGSYPWNFVEHVSRGWNQCPVP